MTTKTKVIIGIAALVVVAGTVYYFYNRNSSSKSSSKEGNGDNASEPQVRFSDIKDLKAKPSVPQAKG